MKEAVNSLISDEVADAVVTARFTDIFSVLGMHQHSDEKSLVARAFLPQATVVEVIDAKTNRKVASLTQVDEAGLFAGKLGRRRNRFKYFLRAHYDDAIDGKKIIATQDPYAFGSLLDEQQVYLFCEGTAERAYQWMGAHQREVDGVKGMLFVLWAPDAQRVSLVGDFNRWDGRVHCMRKHPDAGLWEIFIPQFDANVIYKYEIVASNGQVLPLKADPYAFAMEHPPQTASVAAPPSDYQWQDKLWLEKREALADHYHGPVSIYEVHLGSWRRHLPEQNNDNLSQNAQQTSVDSQFLNYRELAEQLIPYVIDMGFTHIQLMPVSEYPFDGSWGYQPIGLFAPTSRFGKPDDLKYFIDACHQQGLGVLIDWVPGHFPTDEHGTGRFDGACLYEHEDARQGFHPDWKTLIYNYGRKEVQSYLISNAMYWLEQFHVDGLRVDAVSSMLHLDYSREQGQWIPNIHGGRENLEAVELLKQVNSRIYFNFPGAMMIAEESTAWPGVSHPLESGGLGFGFKWNMGWMHDTLQYMSRSPLYRQYHHNEMTFGLTYCFNENFILPLSHDEVVHGKGSLLSKMPGDKWQRFANLRAFYGFMWAHPGKKLLFMGGEFAQYNEWNNNRSLDWHLLEEPEHQGVAQLIKDLNRLYCKMPALHEFDCNRDGFEWLVPHNNHQSLFIFWRKGKDNDKGALVVVNMTPQAYQDYAVGVPQAGFYRECLNTDSIYYGGSNVGNHGGVMSIDKAHDGQQQLVMMNIPPLATVIFECQAQQ